ncbi:protein kinase [Achlya hypogyna]|uniref:Protein kinase n=1 Tax=Achlya hypogyna TaxID=1202772 RepID=A0A1V9YKY4_ACHHY|nr:protein kinase [Achlya hypogyna]
MNVVRYLETQPAVALYAPSIAPPADVKELLSKNNVTWAAIDARAKTAVLWSLGYVRSGENYYKVYTKCAPATTMEQIQVEFKDLNDQCNPDSPCGQNKIVTSSCTTLESMIKCAVDPTSGTPSSPPISQTTSNVVWGWSSSGIMPPNITVVSNVVSGMPFSIHLNMAFDKCGKSALMSSTVPCTTYSSANAASFCRPQPPQDLETLLSKLQPSVVPTAAPITLAPPTTSSLSTGAIIGIAVGAIALLLLLAWCFCSRRSHRGAHDHDAYLAVDEMHLSLTEVNAANQRLGEEFPELALFQVDSAISLKRLDYTNVHLERRVVSAHGYEVLLGYFDQTRVMIKRLAPDARTPRENLVVFTSAVRLMAGIHHPQMTAIVGVGWDLLENLCIVTEFMPAGTLRDALNQQISGSSGKKALWSWKEEKLAVAMDVAKALVYLHTLEEPTAHAGLTSRDVFLVPGTPLAAKVNSAALHPTPLLADSNGVAMANVEWVAPEVLTGHEATLAADIYAFGILLCELDTLAMPYSEASSRRSHGARRSESAPSNLLQRIVKDHLRPELSTSAPQPLVDFVAMCLDRDPTNRPTAMMLVYHLRSKIKPTLQ